jgi:hypothetical protein
MGLPNHDCVRHGEGARDGVGIEYLVQHLARNNTAVEAASRHASEGMRCGLVLPNALNRIAWAMR